MNPILFTITTSELERDVALLDELRIELKLSDAKIAMVIGANKTVLSELRSQAKAVTNGEQVAGKLRSLTVSQRLRAFDKLGYAWARQAFMLAVPTATRDKLLAIDNERTQKNIKLESAVEVGLGMVRYPG